MRNMRLPVALTSALVLIGACAEIPTTAVGSRTLEGGPNYDGGLVFGSGNRSDSTQTTTSSSTSTPDSANTRGGLVFGSGN